MRHKQEPLVDRFWRCVEKTDGCWLWTGAKFGKGGYGTINDGRRGHSVVAHRLSWVLHNGPIPKGLWVLHKCDTPACVNPSHLFLGTRSDNMRDAFEKGRGNFQQNPNLVKRGVEHYRAKLSPEKATEIKRRVALGEKQRVLAVEFGVSQATISCVVHGVYWR